MTPAQPESIASLGSINEVADELPDVVVEAPAVGDRDALAKLGE